MAIPSITASSNLSIVDLIGDTPLIRLRRIERDLPGVELYAKAEWKNPGGSVKDRPALRMVQEGLAAGRLVPGQIILDATSGNTGIAYAMIGAAMGFAVTLCVPENVTPERKRILRAYGAELVFTNPLEGSDGAIRMAQQMNDAAPGKYFYADQYNNDFNWKSHYDTTGPEIIRQAGARLTHFVAGLGTSGTFMGTGRRLREFNPAVVLASVQPDSPLHGLEGLKHMESAMVPGIYDASLADRDVRVGTEEAYEMTRRLAQEEGLLVGISSGANLVGALEVARPGAVIVVVFCDGGERYLSERFWENPPEGASIGGTN
ncbi:MAG: cysteine synthase family protein [Acidobacteriota bacterium]|nr:cysteine synthase family protein [Acidobacteriota bacterium]